MNFFGLNKKVSIHVESLHFPMFSAKCENQKEGWSLKNEKWSWKSHGKIFCQVCGNPEG